MRQRKNSTTTPTSDNENLLITDLKNLLTELTEEEMQACWGGIGPAGPDYSLSIVKESNYQLNQPKEINYHLRYRHVQPA
ncbi:MAG: hypothetical protein JO235_00385 [Chroococcidiopsidaceae cyanobacterium CP_BM_RX_35]|nr:hypothetical protein [Chroococcidiopsidaceae cyanobacterium CP_BM_RX_35]